MQLLSYLINSHFIFTASVVNSTLYLKSSSYLLLFIAKVVVYSFIDTIPDISSLHICWKYCLFLEDWWLQSWIQLKNALISSCFCHMWSITLVFTFWQILPYDSEVLDLHIYWVVASRGGLTHTLVFNLSFPNKLQVPIIHDWRWAQSHTKITGKKKAMEGCWYVHRCAVN